jgi:hypothetical protein
MLVLAGPGHLVTHHFEQGTRLFVTITGANELLLSEGIVRGVPRDPERHGRLHFRVRNQQAAQLRGCPPFVSLEMSRGIHARPTSR